MTTISSKDFFSKGPVKVIGNETTQQTAFTQPQETKPSLLDKLKSTGSEFGTTINNISSEAGSGSLDPVSATVQSLGAGGKAIVQGAGDVLSSTPVVKDVVDTVQKPISSGVKAFQDWLANNPTFQKTVTSSQADKIASILDAHPDIAKNAEAINNIANAALIIDGGAKVTNKLSDLASNIKSSVEDSAHSLPNIEHQDLYNKAIETISADPEKKVQTILKESTPEELQKHLDLAQKASVDPRAQTPYEHVGEQMKATAEQLKKQLTPLAEQKQAIINENSIGGKQFISEIDDAIKKFDVLSTKYPEAAQFRDALKGAVTKADADAAIDDMQDILYTGGKKMTIPTGSRFEKIAKSVVGELNNKLKNSLPEEYTTINNQYAEIAQHLGTLNRSLGEVVDGVPVQGASLVKQFFSPSGSKAKQLFAFIKDKTGVDLAKESTLAKFAMDIFDDPRSRSLLENIGDVPTTASGVVSKVVEKVGGEKLKEALRQGTIRKAKNLLSE